MATPRMLLAAALLACGAAAVLTGCTPADSGPTVAAASAAALADEGADDLLDEDDGLFYEEEEYYSGSAEPSAAFSSASPDSPASPDVPAPPDSPDAPASPDEPSAEPSTESSAGPGCAVPTGRPGHEFLVVVSAGPAELTARSARFSCGSARYEPVGSPVHYGFAGAGVAATLVDVTHDEPARTVRLDELIAHIDDCLAEREPADPYGCHGNAYDVVLDSHGRIMRIGEVEGP
ncbi:hypothetical protein [Kitasatospora sp. MY 5-36]|uniref:hypothetical protein n=1 Tax=Kitasatospora sp. MY 5-36 TaxID=1678027 RepID=UPI0006707EF6|nr:hypothetical protein [Kitasatospora sp. MY 5-36]